jgi:hypothetical protein
MLGSAVGCKALPARDPARDQDLIGLYAWLRWRV